MKIILGSSSPRRKDILASFFKNFQIVIPEVEENILDNEKPVEFARRISEKKMNHIIDKVNYDSPCLIITSDTAVTINEEISGKPVDYDNAFAMISSLSGKTHEVISGLSLYIINEKNEKMITTDHETTKVTFKELSSDTINKYLESINYSDKAGAYAIQEYGEMIIEKIDGSLTNVIGFPVRLFLRMLVQCSMIHIL